MTEREAFEAWWSDFHTTIFVSQQQYAWLVWQAARAQTAQAVPLLSDDPLFIFAQEVIHGAYKPDELKDAAMRAIRHHSAVRAKLGAGVPMTGEQITAISRQVAEGGPEDSIDRFVRAIERHHGIVGKEGA